jgi:glycosyltransferase involved in cell wall biosynthesis
MVRVVHIIQNLNYGGMERVLHSLARRLPPRGFEVHIVVLQYLGRFAEGLEDSVTIHQVPPMSRLSLFHPGKLITLFRKLAPDVVHSHTGVWLKASRAARVAGIPVMVHTEHGRLDPVPLSDRLIDNRASRWTDMVIAVSEALAELLRRQVVHDPARVRVITNGVDVDLLRPPVDRAALRRDLGLPPNAQVIGSIGRLEPVKNYQLTLRAFARLGERPSVGGPPLLVIAGDGTERPRLEALATDLGIASRVRFLGWRDDPDRLYGAFDVFTLSSRSEGTSVSLLEAMSTGVCPVATDVGGNRAVLGPELEGLLVPSEDDAALAAAWARQLADPALRSSMGARARHRVETGFSLERMIDQHVDLYHDLLERRGARRRASTVPVGRTEQ